MGCLFNLNLNMKEAKYMSEKIVITSGKGGVGKTTTTASLGVGLAMRGNKVVVMDIDTGLRNLDLLLGLENRIMYDLVDVTTGRVPYKKALVRHRKYESLFLLPTSQVQDKNAVKPEQVDKLCKEMDKDFDYILLDCPAGIEEGFKTAIIAAIMPFRFADILTFFCGTFFLFISFLFSIFQQSTLRVGYFSVLLVVFLFAQYFFV